MAYTRRLFSESHTRPIHGQVQLVMCSTNYKQQRQKQSDSVHMCKMSLSECMHVYRGARKKMVKICCKELMILQ